MLWAFLLVAVFAAGPAATADEPPPIPTSATWLATVNYHRSMAGLPPVAANSTWSTGGWWHSRYMVKNNQITHQEDPANPYYTSQGDAAGQNGNVTLGGLSFCGERSHVEDWIVGPFHGLGILDPRLQTSGYGTYSESGLCGGTLDVLRGRTGAAPVTPVAYPAGGMTTPLLRYWGYESPDPLTSCAGYSAPTGAPIYLQLPHTSSLTSTSLTAGGAVQQHCAFDGNTYTNPNSAWQSLGRSILSSRNAVVIIPRNPLVSGATYAVNVKSGATDYTWAFQACSSPPCRAESGSDLNLDGRSDLLWYNAATGQLLTWLMRGTVVGSSVSHGVIGGAWTLAATGDFNSDGHTDLVWHNGSNGLIMIWLMKGAVVESAVPLGSSTAWHIVATGDFNKDSKTDLVWQHSSGQLLIWFMNGTVFQGSAGLGTLLAPWKLVVSADLDRNGSSDLVWNNQESAQYFVWMMNGPVVQSVAYLGAVHPQWEVAGTGDFNMDGRADLVWHNTGTHQYVLWLMNGVAFQGLASLGTVGAPWVLVP